MNPSQEAKAVSKINKITIVIFLLFVIASSGVYGTLKFMEVYNLLATPLMVSNTTTLDSHQKELLLSSVSPEGENIEEKEKLDMLSKLSVRQDEIDSRSRSALLDLLR